MHTSTLCGHLIWATNLTFPCCSPGLARAPEQRRVGGRGQKEVHAATSLGRSWPALEADAVAASAPDRLPASQPGVWGKQLGLTGQKRLWPREPDPPHSPGSSPQPPHTHYLVSPEPYEGSKYNSYTHFTSGKTCLENRTFAWTVLCSFQIYGLVWSILLYMTVFF